MIFSGSNISVQQKVAELVTLPSEGGGDVLVDEETKGSTKSSADNCKTAGDVASKDSILLVLCMHQSTEASFCQVVIRM